MKRDNQGFSLLELIVVLAILAIMLWLIVPAIGAQFSSEAMTTANKIDSAVAKCKLDNMTLSAVHGSDLANRKVYLTIESLADGIYATVENGGSASTTQKLASSRVALTPARVRMTFNRATGALELWDTSGSGDPASASFYQIKVVGTTNGSTYYVDIYTLTGFHEVTYD